MSESTIFILGLVNLGMLITAMVWGLKKTVRGFFFARSASIEKYISAATEMLQSARARASEEEEKSGGLTADIAVRKKAISARTEEDCATIVKDAREIAKRYKEGAVRRGERERLRAKDGVRKMVLADAFRRAEKTLTEGMDDKMKRKVMEKSLDEFSGLLSEGPSETYYVGGF